MRELPQGWEWSTLGQIAGYGNTVKVEPSDIKPEEWVLELEDIEKDTSKLLLRIYNTERRSKSTKNRFKKDDILYGKLRPYLNKVILADKNGVCSTEIIPLTAPVGIDNRYLFHSLKRPDFLEYVTSISHGVNMPRLGTKAGQEALIPLAPLNEQKRIADKLDALLARVDACRERLDRVPQVLKRFRQAVLAAATSGVLTEEWREKNPGCVGANGVRPSAMSKDGADGNKGACHAPLQDRGEGEELPEGWQITSIGKVCESLKYGTSQKCSYEKNGVPVLRIPNIEDGFIGHDDLKYADLPVKEFQLLRLKSGDILVIRSNGSVSLVGKSALVRDAEKDFAYAGYLIRIRPDQTKIAPEYLNLTMASYDVRTQIEIPARSTSGVNNINSDELRALSFNLPPLPEQQEIVRRVETLFAFADRLEARYTTARRQVDQLTPSLLAKAFRGELVPQDPNDEPADKLLERISAERAKPSSAPAKRRKIPQK